MAIRGINTSEREAVIHPDDPGHPDNVEMEIERRNKAFAKGNGLNLSDLSEDDRASIRQEVEADKEFQPTKYYIGVLTASDRVELGDMVATPTMRNDSISLTPRNNERIAEVVRRGLKGWDNQQDSEGNVVKFEQGTSQNGKGRPIVVASEKSIAVLPVIVVNWLSSQISEKNGMTNSLVKKSSGVSQQSLDQLFASGDAPNALTTSDENADASDQPNEK